MAEQATKPRVPNKGSWAKGVSGNPSGRRPRPALAFAEKVRERVDPDMVIDLAMRVAQDEKLSPEQRLAALWPLIDRGFIKPPAGLDVSVTNGNATDDNTFSHLTLERRRELLAEIRGPQADEPQSE